MSVVTLTFIASEEEITSGVPKYITIESNIPSTIYYTLDGTTPTINSLIYIDTLLFDNVDSITLKAFGVDNLSQSGPILSETFSADQTRIDRTRNVGQEGFVIERDGTEPQYIAGYSADGYVYMNFEPEIVNMDKVHSEKGLSGLYPGTQVPVAFPDRTSDESEKYDLFVPFSTTEVAEFFNPYARFILIDTRKQNELNPILRPFGSLENVYKEFGGKRILNVADDACYVSGGFVRRFYNQATNTMVSFYYDHNEARWIKSIQTLPAGAPAMPNSVGIQSNAGQPLVYQWIYRGKGQGGLV